MPGRRALGDGDGRRFGHMLGRDAETVGVCDTCLRHAETFSVLGHRPLRHGACGVSLTLVFFFLFVYLYFISVQNLTYTYLNFSDYMYKEK